MSRVGILLAFASLGLGVSAGAARKTEPAPSHPRVMIETALGEIEVELDAKHAPATVANFLHYVDEGMYNGGRFHRTVRADNQGRDQYKIGVIQGGIAPGRDHETFPPIALERTSVSKLRHRDGTISLARDGPDSATSDFFICVGDQPELDFGGRRNADGQGFAAFGQVVHGMDIVHAIQSAPAGADQELRPPVEIKRVRRLGAEPVR